MAAATILVVSFLSTFLDPVTNGLGRWLLTMPSLHGFWTHLYNMPVMPWTDFNNTVVLGSLAVGIGLVYPVYRFSKPVFRKYTEPFSEWAKKFWLTKVLLGAEWVDRFGTAGSTAP